MAGALHVLTLAHPASTFVSPCPCSHETFPNTAWPSTVLVLSLRAYPATGGVSRSSVGWKRVVRSRKRPSNEGGSTTCAGALCVAASRRRRTGRSTGNDDDDDERAMSSGALVVCAETRKLPRASEEREMFECRAL